MPIIDSKLSKIVFDPEIKELEEIAKKMRAYSITAITSAGSGHTGGTMSIIDIAAVLYFKIINHDPKNPEWDNRDRVFWSVGHKAPALYASLGLAGYFDINDIVLLRKLGSGFEGHPNRFKLPGIEASSGSLGQGLGIAVGDALSARLKNKNYRIYCILGDGELDEGSVWEAAMSAAHYNLNNLIAVIDRNNLQIDGFTSEVMEIEPLKEKWISFGWQVFECNGHNIKELVSIFEKASDEDSQAGINGGKNIGKNFRPKVIIAKTKKGKCISYAENVCAYHGICPKDGVAGIESLETALKDIGEASFTKDFVNLLLEKSEKYQKDIDIEVDLKVPKFSKDYFWNRQNLMRVEMDPTRMGFGRAIEKLGSDPRVVALGADITESIRMSAFYANNPERKNRFFSMGIAEQNMTAVASGLAKEGFIPFIGSYGVFITGRNWDQLRTTVCYNNFNVKIADAHAGISVGPDGATHQALEDISNLCYLPNMNICVPADSIEAYKATFEIKEIYGPAAIRLAREATPIVTKESSDFVFGKANVIRFRKAYKNFIDSFEICTSDKYKNENEDISIIACGPMVAEAMRAAYILRAEYGLEVRILNIHTVKPIDRTAISRAAAETGLILTAEEHQVGGFGNIIAGVISTEKKFIKPYFMQMIGINDRFGESGSPWNLMKSFELTAEFIADKAVKLLERKEKESKKVKTKNKIIK